MEQNQGIFPFRSLSLPSNYVILTFKIISLMATVRVFRSDLLTNEGQQAGQPITNEMPPHFLDQHIPRIEGIGEPTTATFFTHSNIDPTNWFTYPSPPLPLRL